MVRYNNVLIIFLVSIISLDLGLVGIRVHEVWALEFCWLCGLASGYLWARLEYKARSKKVDIK